MNSMRSLLSKLPSHRKIGGITGPKFSRRPLHSFHEEEQEVLDDWSLLPDLFQQWDMNNSGAVDREELLYGMKAFCRFNKIVYSVEVGLQIMEYVDRNRDDRFDQQEMKEFLVIFGRCVNVSPFDIIYFMQSFLTDREDWIIEGKQTLLVPARRSYRSKFERAMSKLFFNLERERLEEEVTFAT